MAARGRHFHRTLGHGLPTDIAEIRILLGHRRDRRGVGARRCELARARQQRRHLGHVPDAKYRNAVHHCGLRRILRRNDQIRNALLARADGHRQRAAHRPDGAIERQFADQQMPVQPAHGAHRTQDAHGHRQIEARAFFAHVGRSQIDGHRLIRITESGIDEGALDALPAFADRRVRHADHDEIASRPGRVHIHFHVDGVCVDAVNRGGTRSEQCHAGYIGRLRREP